jgi:tetratricopeptide (TPR) repeat protein
MKLTLLTSYLLTGLVCLPLDFVSPTKVLAADQVMRVAQNRSAQYTQYMSRGYDLTRRRNYSQALKYFQKALQIRPGDRYAISAIRNVTGYIQRRRVIAFVPSKPGRRSPGATRGGGIIALIPGNEKAQQTTAENPKFWFYIKPESLGKVKELKFVLREGDGKRAKPLYETTVTPVGQEGIVSLTVPVDKASLKTGEKYIWTFAIIYPDDLGVPNEELEGEIQRVQNENLTNQIQQATQPLDQAMIYAREGFWDNALSIVADLRCQRPNDTQVRENWEDLLQSVELEKLANQPILSCGNSQN